MINETQILYHSLVNLKTKYIDTMAEIEKATGKPHVYSYNYSTILNMLNNRIDAAERSNINSNIEKRFKNLGSHLLIAENPFDLMYSFTADGKLFTVDCWEGHTPVKVGNIFLSANELNDPCKKYIENFYNYRLRQRRAGQWRCVRQDQFTKVMLQTIRELAVDDTDRNAVNIKKLYSELVKHIKEKILC